MIKIHSEAKPVTKGPKHHFFGYYDKSPWDISGRYILALEIDFSNRDPDPQDQAVIGLIDTMNNYNFTPIATTTAWNWQQGCMLQWLPSSAGRTIIYNDREKDHFTSVILDIKNNKRKVLLKPIYAVSANGKYALSLNFSRLHHTRRGYGYSGILDPWENELCPEEDGIYLIDLSTGEIEFIFSLLQIASFNHRSSMDHAIHWVNHLLFNPGSTRFCFLHRWYPPDSELYFTRMLTADISGENLYCLIDHDMVSHFDWYDNSKILAWARQRDAFRKVRRNPFYKSTFVQKLLSIYRGSKVQNFVHKYSLSEAYFLFTDLTKETKIIGNEILTADGHCSFSPDRKWILTDTYPDENNEQALILYNVERDIPVEIGKFYSEPKFKDHIRCDFHPRWNRSGTKICIDSSHSGDRQMYVLDVSERIDNIKNILRKEQK